MLVNKMKFLMNRIDFLLWNFKKIYFILLIIYYNEYSYKYIQNTKEEIFPPKKNKKKNTF